MADTPSPPSPEILEKLRQLREELAQKAAQQAPKDANTLAWQQSNAFKRVYPRANGGQIKAKQSDPELDALFQEPTLTMDERFRKYVAPVVREGLNSGLDAMFPMRGLAREAFKKGVFLPFANFYKKNANDLDDADVQGKVEEYKRIKDMELRNKIGLRQLPVEYDLSKFNRRLVPNSFPNPDNPIEVPKSLERDWTELLSQPKAKGGVIDMDRMRLELMNKGGLSKQKRDANLSKFLENSVVSNPMYHSTVNDFNTFGKTKDIGYHFGSKHVANERLKDVTSSRPKSEESISGANVMPVHLNIKQPIYVKNDPGFWSPLKFLKEPFWKIDTTISRKEYNDLSELGKSTHANAEEEEARIKADRNIKRLPSNERTELLSKHHKPFWDEARRLLMRDGFDGLEYANTYEGQGKNKIERRKNPDNTTYVAFHPHQIKSAIGNRGTYDINDPDITKKNGGITHAHHLDIEERPL